jgi:hypothetical protein
VSVLIIFLLGSSSVIGGVCVAHLFGFLCGAFCFVCLRPVSVVPNVLSILDCSFGFLGVYLLLNYALL